MILGSKKLVIVFGIATVLSSLAIPLSSARASKLLVRDSVSVNVGIAPYVGISIINNTAGTGVTYSNGVYSKTMQNGEHISNFGTTRLKVICNIDEHTENLDTYGTLDCRNNGWSLNIAPASGYTTTVDGVSYATMVGSAASTAILSSSADLSGSTSTWGIMVIPVSKTVSGTSVSASAATGYDSMHIIPASTAPIATSTSWRTINGTSTYIESFELDIQYGVGVSSTQPAGTYTGVVDYTISLNASS